IAVIGGKVAIDAVPDRGALGHHHDVLGDGHAAVDVDQDVAVVLGNALGGGHRDGKQRHAGEQRQAHAPHVGRPWSSCTWTVARASSSAAKKSASRNTVV